MPTSLSGRPRIAVTLGDAAGIGPETVVKALGTPRPKSEADIVVLGRALLYNELAHKLKQKILFRDIDSFPEFGRKTSFIPCYFPMDVPRKISYGKTDPALTKLAVASITLAAKLAMCKAVHAIVTPPINKAGLKEAGFDIPGHTEFLAELSGTRKFEMMLIGGPLRVVPVTRHVALRQVANLLTKERIAGCIQLVAHELRASFGIKNPRILICGLNPHAGDSGHFGDEEIRVIAPAVLEAKKKIKGATLIGPLSPDALFFRAYRDGSDAVICMYHDQGLIPLKMIAMDSGVNVTLGLPFVRTSPDHGTGYDIAGKFIASPQSMIESIRLAALLSKNRRSQ